MSFFSISSKAESEEYLPVQAAGDLIEGSSISKNISLCGRFLAYGNGGYDRDAAEAYGD
jgi:hypothetical protein